MAFVVKFLVINYTPPYSFDGFENPPQALNYRFDIL